MTHDSQPSSPHSPNIKCASHLAMALKPCEIRRIVPLIITRLSAYNFDSIAFQGLSGSLIAPIVAYEMNKTLIAVRKALNCHSSKKVEGDYAAKRYVILDDFISSGKTCARIIDEIKEAIPDAHCIGICTYLFLDIHNCGEKLESPECWQVVDARRWMKNSQPIPVPLPTLPPIDLDTRPAQPSIDLL